ncbi:cytochrome P450 [Testicularia cyperi]|uniref:Cytochrome P450 n=1 Tax=Testicularia cyperi TaxID=1882483 RepID=A0A317XJ51_9BASI|nr:cytochrome P450 [Testicularia cyperi]
MIEVSTSGGLSSSPYFWAVAAVLVAILFNNLLRAPSSLRRDASPIKAYSDAVLPGIGPIELYEKRNSFLRSIFGDPESWHKSPPKQTAVRVNSRGHIMTITNNPKVDGKVFFNDRGLDFNNAYEVMFAGIPQLPEWISKPKPDEVTGAAGFVYNLKLAVKPERLQNNIPHMVAHAVNLFKTLPAHNGRFTVHDTIYPLVFQISVLFVGLAEHARDINAVRKMEGPFWTFADNVGFMPTHFPLFPVPSTVKKWYGAVKMSAEIRGTLQKRRQENRREDDYIQEMIDRGASDRVIEDFIMGGLFAAIINTTGVASYFLLFLHSDPVARDRVRSEFESVFRRAAEERGDDYDSLSLQEKLERTPLEVWESSLPYYEHVLDETLRILMTSLIFRRKLQTDSKASQTESVISGERINNKEFIGFWLGSAHRNSTIYTDPEKFDPGRFERGEGRGDNEFVPWGAGRHVCLGMRFAKLEIKTVHAAFLLAFPTARCVDRNNAPYSPDNVPYPEKESEHRRLPQHPVWIAYDSNHLA